MGWSRDIRKLLKIESNEPQLYAIISLSATHQITVFKLSRLSLKITVHKAVNLQNSECQIKNKDS